VSTKRVGVVRGIVIAILCVAYPLLTYLGARSPQPNVAAAIVAFAPILAMLGWLTWQSPQRLALSLLAAVLAAVMWAQREFLLQHYDWAYLLQYAGTMGLLGFIFGRTLRPGFKPLVSRFAEVAHGGLSPRLARYTRGVTWAWTLFFAAMCLLSIALFLTMPLATWALLANGMSPLLVLTMFVAEYLVRLRAIPPHERTGPIEAVRAYARYSMAAAAPGSTAVRPPVATTAESAPRSAAFASDPPEGDEKIWGGPAFSHERPQICRVRVRPPEEVRKFGAARRFLMSLVTPSAKRR
jgi:uncharacterized membrane protein